MITHEFYTAKIINDKKLREKEESIFLLEEILDEYKINLPFRLIKGDAISMATIKNLVELKGYNKTKHYESLNELLDDFDVIVEETIIDFSLNEFLIKVFLTLKYAYE